MTNTLILIGVIAIASLLAVVFVGLQRSASKEDVRAIAHQVKLGRGKLLVENIERVKSGQTKAELEGLLGKADNPADRQWIYYLDEHSGYTIAFDGVGRVATLNSWKS